MLLFCSSFFGYVLQRGSRLSVSSVDFFCISPLTHLSFRCLSVQSAIKLVVCPHSFISVGGCQGGGSATLVGSARGADAL